jgi:hypothetical protein
VHLCNSKKSDKFFGVRIGSGKGNESFRNKWEGLKKGIFSTVD